MTNTGRDFIFWVEAGQGVGMGHLSRSMVVAWELLKAGQAISFIINPDPAAGQRLTVEHYPFNIGNLDSGELPPNVGQRPDVFIFDTKKDITSLIIKLQAAGHRVALLDNTTPARLAADIDIYPSATFSDGLDWAGYRGRVYSGASYVPVGETFLEARGKSRALGHQPPFHILVTMGGSDPKHLTYQVVSALRSLPGADIVDIVIGPAFRHDPQLGLTEAENNPCFRFVRGRSNLSGLMAESHIAITAVGTTIYELAAVGVPAIIIANFDADRRDLDAYRKLGMNLPLDVYSEVTPLQIRQAVASLIENAETWQRKREQGWELIDGHGARRIADGLLSIA